MMFNPSYSWLVLTYILALCPLYICVGVGVLCAHACTQAQLSHNLLYLEELSNLDS